MTLYLVDDDQLELELFRIALHKLQPTWNTFIFSDAKVMMTQMAQIVPDILVVDLVMPFLPGTEVCKWMHENYPDVKVYFNTSLEGEEYELLAKICNAVYLSKMKSFEERVEVIADGYES